MEPTRNSHATLVDLLDRVLDKGLIIHADLIISLAGVPLIGVNLRTALAGMETMIQYGIMEEWDKRTRACESERRKVKRTAVTSGEEVLLEMPGSYHYSQGIYTTWRTGRIYLTDKKLILYNPSFEEVLFETTLQRIKGLTLEEDRCFTEKAKENLCLLLDSGDVVQLHAIDMPGLKEAIERRLLMLGLTWQQIPRLSLHDERTASFLIEGEEVVCQGETWYLAFSPTTGIATSQNWKHGHLYLTNRRLCWWHDFEKRLVFQVPLEHVVASVLVTNERKAVYTNHRKRGLDVIYQGEHGKEVASFSGEHLTSWESELNRIVSSEGIETNGNPERTDLQERIGSASVSPTLSRGESQT
jgi:hypothetical protein